jgi:hypothetical protein
MNPAALLAQLAFWTAMAFALVPAAMWLKAAAQ